MRLSHKSHNGNSELIKWRILVVQFIFLFLEMEEGMQNITDYMKQQALLCEKNDNISVDLYSQYGVKRGLRDENGQGVLTGLTNISEIKAFEFSQSGKVQRCK